MTFECDPSAPLTVPLSRRSCRWVNCEAAALAEDRFCREHSDMLARYDELELRGELLDFDQDGGEW